MEYNSSNTINYASGCPYRLPCGYCEKLCRDCPKVFYNGQLDIDGTQPYPGAIYATTTATNTKE